jgi:hypothetical protein
MRDRKIRRFLPKRDLCCHWSQTASPHDDDNKKMYRLRAGTRAIVFLGFSRTFDRFSVVVEKFLDQIHMRQKHPPTAISFQSKLIQSVTIIVAKDPIMITSKRGNKKEAVSALVCLDICLFLCLGRAGGLPTMACSSAATARVQHLTQTRPQPRTLRKSLLAKD